MLLKQIQFFGKNEQGQVFCQPLLDDGLTKTASASTRANLHPQVADFVRTVRPSKHGVYVLVNALGAGEIWGSNINGDHFPERELIHAPSDWETLSIAQMKEKGKKWEYGFPTFMGAHPYKHHVNKDSSRAFGSVEIAVWNSKMRRVELVVYLDRALCKKFDAYDVIEKIERGEFPDVSMGCFPAGSLVTMADGTRRPIEQVRVGMEVISHTGNHRTVTELHPRKYQGLLYSIRPEAHRVIRATRQHPFLVVSESQVKKKDDKGNLVWRDDAKLQPEWLHAECLTTEHYLLEPVPKPNGNASFDENVETSLMRLLGYYLAEGHILRDKKGAPCGIELTTNVEDAIHDEIERLCEVIGTKNKPVTFRRQNSDKALGIWIFDESLARTCLTKCGELSANKRLSSDLLSHSRESVLHLLGSYANGDGCGSEDGSLKFSTCNEQLAYQLQRMLLRVGLISSISRLEHGPSTLVNKDTTEFVVHVGKQWAQLLRPYCSKVKPVEVVKAKNSRKIIDGYLVTPIREIDAIYVETEVFNFEVEQDNSYLVEGLVVHNCKVPYDVCSICQHKSKTPKDYCEHAKMMMNKIFPDGRKVFVYNPRPRFFDISFVFIGADKTAKVMAKLASKGNQICLGEYCTIPRLSAEVGEVFSKEASSAQQIREPEQNTPAPFPEARDQDSGSLFDPTFSDFVRGKSRNQLIRETHEAAGPFNAKLYPPSQLDVNDTYNGQASNQLKVASVKTANDPIKKFIHVQGIPIMLEWLNGETRKYASGFSQHMKADYGYIPGTLDADGEQLDVYVGRDKSSELIFIINQLKDDGSFDERKVMIGYPDEEAAKASYLDHMPKKRLGKISRTTISDFKKKHLVEVKAARRDRDQAPVKTAGVACGCHGLGDDCGGTAEKVAHAVFPGVRNTEKSASHRKLSEIIKSIPAGPFSKETLPKLERAERDIPKETLDRMGEMDLGRALSTPAMMGIVLKPREFQRVMLVRIGEKSLADELDSKGEVFRPSSDVDESLSVDPSRINHLLKELLQAMGLFRDRSAAATPISRRLERMKERLSDPRLKQESTEKTASTTEPLLRKLAAAYNGYRRSIIKKAAAIQHHIVSDPQLAAEAFGGSMAQAFAGGISKTASTSVFSPDSLAYLTGAYHTDRDLHVADKGVVASLAQMGTLTEAMS